MFSYSTISLQKVKPYFLNDGDEYKTVGNVTDKRILTKWMRRGVLVTIRNY